MVKPSEHDLRYLFDGANEITDRLYAKDIPKLLSRGCELLTRLYDDLAPDARIAVLIANANKEIASASQDAIERCLESFERVEVEAFKKEKAHPVMVQMIQHEAQMARLHLKSFQPSPELIRERVGDLAKAVCDAEKNLKYNEKAWELSVATQKVALGGATYYVNTTADFILLLPGIVSAGSIWLGSVIAASGLGVGIDLGKFKFGKKQEPDE